VSNDKYRVNYYYVTRHLDRVVTGETIRALHEWVAGDHSHCRPTQNFIQHKNGSNVK